MPIRNANVLLNVSNTNKMLNNVKIICGGFVKNKNAFYVRTKYNIKMNITDSIFVRKRRVLLSPINPNKFSQSK